MLMDPGNDEKAHRKVAFVEKPTLHRYHPAGPAQPSPKAASGEVASAPAAAPHEHAVLSRRQFKLDVAQLKVALS